MKNKFNLEKLENKLRVLTYFGFETNYQNMRNSKNTIFLNSEKNFLFRDFDVENNNLSKNLENLNISKKKDCFLIRRIKKRQKIFKIKRKKRFIISRNTFILK